MFNSKNTFKPRYGKNNQSYLPLPNTFNNLNKRKNIPLIILSIIVIWYIFNPYSWITSLLRSSTLPHYPQQHPYSSRFVIEQNSKYIYPPIEHAPTLKQITPQKLITSSKIGDKTILKSLNSLDNPDPTVQKLKEDDENSKDLLMKAKNFFKNQDKIIYKSKNSQYPQVILVTAVDFEKYSVDGLAKIVQNRVDYAHYQKYGIYVRWAQEFIPQLGSFDTLKDEEKSKWVRLFCLRAAMFAFPEAKWFWYLDQDSMVMDLTVNIEEILLNENSLNKLMIRDQPLIPRNGVIKTYKKIKPENVKLILTQSSDMIETTSFIIKNDPTGKALVDIWSDNLYYNYGNFPYGPDSALTHILQWHPFILSKTILVPRRIISSDHPFRNNNKKSTAKGATSEFDYDDGDFVVQWNKCKGEECETLAKSYHSKIKKPKN